MKKKNNFLGTSIALFYGLEIMKELSYEIYIEQKKYFKAFLTQPIRFILSGGK